MVGVPLGSSLNIHVKFNAEVDNILHEMGLASIERASSMIPDHGRTPGSEHERRNLAIMRASPLERNINRHFDPHNVLPPVVVVLNDIPHKDKRMDPKVLERAKSLSTPNNIVLVADGTAGGFTGPKKSLHMLSYFTIVHNWAHTMAATAEGRKLAVMIYLTAIEAYINCVGIEKIKSLYGTFFDDIRRGAIPFIKCMHDASSCSADVRASYNEWISMFGNTGSVDGSPPVPELFAIPSDSDEEFVFNMFCQYVKFGKVTLRGASRDQMKPYTDRIQQLFDIWAKSQVGTVVNTLERYFEPDEI